MSRTYHLFVGIAVLLIFFATGLFMRMNFPELYGENQAIRYQFRANHIYILFCALVNLALGIYLKPAVARWQKRVQLAGSIILLVATLLLVMAFFVDPPQGGPVRAVTTIGVFLSLAGVMMHVASGYEQKGSQ